MYVHKPTISGPSGCCQSQGQRPHGSCKIDCQGEAWTCHLFFPPFPQTSWPWLKFPPSARRWWGHSGTEDPMMMNCACVGGGRSKPWHIFVELWQWQLHDVCSPGTVLIVLVQIKVEYLLMLMQLVRVTYSTSCAGESTPRRLSRVTIDVTCPSLQLTLECCWICWLHKPSLPSLVVMNTTDSAVIFSAMSREKSQITSKRGCCRAAVTMSHDDVKQTVTQNMILILKNFLQYQDKEGLNYSLLCYVNMFIFIHS